jgi:hypothetical protein
MTKHEKSRGQALVEFALILPLFVLVLLGLFDAGRAVYAFNTVSNVARAAARQAIVDQTPANVRTAGRDVASGLTVAIDPVPCSETDCLYQVTVRCRFQPITPMLGSIFKPDLSSTVSMPIENKNPTAPQTTPVSEGTPTC